jgi:hypothetical protein
LGGSLSWTTRESYLLSAEPWRGDLVLAAVGLIGRAAPERLKMFRIFLALALLATSGIARAQQGQAPLPPGPFQGTPEEQTACRRDSTTFCRDAVPDTFRVLACLQQNRQRISKACREVLESHGQ